MPLALIALSVIVIISQLGLVFSRVFGLFKEQALADNIIKKLIYTVKKIF